VPSGCQNDFSQPAFRGVLCAERAMFCTLSRSYLTARRVSLCRVGLLLTVVGAVSAYYSPGPAMEVLAHVLLLRLTGDRYGLSPS